jgi:hypothetical protein
MSSVAPISFLWCCYGTAIRETEPADEEANIIMSEGIVASRAGKEGQPDGEESPVSVGSTEPSDSTPTDGAELESPDFRLRTRSPRGSVSAAEPPSDGPFDVRLDMRVGERLGALLDILDLKTLRVVHVREEGRLKKYNDDAPAHKRVHPGFFIVQVNGKSGDVETMVDELQRTRVWKLKVARIYHFSVTLQKTGPLCLDLHFEPEGNCVVIRRIGDGVAKEHNNNVPEGGEQIQVGDRIYSVNGEVAPASQLLAKIRSSETVTLQLGRPQM